MAYIHKPVQDPVPAIEQTRRRNAALRIELTKLEAENKHLEAQAVTARLQVTTARKALTRKIRQLEATRAQIAMIEQVKQQQTTQPEPKYGGREGLQAALDEIDAYEAKNGKLGTVPRIGTRVSRRGRRAA